MLSEEDVLHWFFSVSLLHLLAASSTFRNCFACGDHTGFHMTYMSEFTAAKLDGVFYYELTVLRFDHLYLDLSTWIAYVEWRLLCKDSSFCPSIKTGSSFVLRSLSLL